MVNELVSGRHGIGNAGVLVTRSLCAEIWEEALEIMQPSGKEAQLRFRSFAPQPKYDNWVLRFLDACSRVWNRTLFRRGW
jgi:hypothetical protein